MAHGACKRCGNAVEECTCDWRIINLAEALADEWAATLGMRRDRTYETANNVCMILREKAQDGIHVTEFAADVRWSCNHRVVQRWWLHETNVDLAVEIAVRLATAAGYFNTESAR